MTSIYSYDGKSDIGYQKSINEDFIDAVELDERTLLLFVADGTNSDPDGGLQPASIAIHEMGTMLKLSHIPKRESNLCHCCKCREYPFLFNPVNQRDTRYSPAYN